MAEKSSSETRQKNRKTWSNRKKISPIFNAVPFTYRSSSYLFHGLYVYVYVGYTGTIN